MKSIIAITVILGLILACNGLVNPPSGPGTEYPCGVNGVVCQNKGLVALCCPQNHICGYNGAFSRCEALSCCYDGPDWLTRPDAGIRQIKYNSGIISNEN